MRHAWSFRLLISYTGRMRVQLQTLKYFIALAQYKSFTDAASACFISQPALSRAIAGLE